MDFVDHDQHKKKNFCREIQDPLVIKENRNGYNNTVTFVLEVKGIINVRLLKNILVPYFFFKDHK